MTLPPTSTWHSRRLERQSCPSVAKATLSLLLCGLLLLSSANAFSVLSQNVALSSSPLTTTKRTTTTTTMPTFYRGSVTTRFAVIYGADGETHHEDNSKISSYSSSSSSSRSSLYYEDPASPAGVSPTMATIMDSLSSETAALARMVVAFAPKEHNLKLDDIQAVHVLNVDVSYIELSAVLCEQYDCLTVAVPVSFPRSCQASAGPSTTTGVESLEDCIVENVVKLGELAEIKIRDIELGCPRTKIFKSLIQNDNLVDLPFWWVEPTSLLRADCDSMRTLLNDNDFQAELQALAMKTISERSDDEYQVDQVGVAAVGPAGMFLRAHASGHILELPLGFASGVAVDVEGLRGSVLDLVEQVEEECLD
jgi:hypothetical protein